MQFKKHTYCHLLFSAKFCSLFDQVSNQFVKILRPVRPLSRPLPRTEITVTGYGLLAPSNLTVAFIVSWRQRPGVDVVVRRPPATRCSVGGRVSTLLGRPCSGQVSAPVMCRSPRRLPPSLAVCPRTPTLANHQRGHLSARPVKVRV